MKWRSSVCFVYFPCQSKKLAKWSRETCLGISQTLMAIKSASVLKEEDQEKMKGKKRRETMTEREKKKKKRSNRLLFNNRCNNRSLERTMMYCLKKERTEVHEREERRKPLFVFEEHHDFDHRHHHHLLPLHLLFSPSLLLLMMIQTRSLLIHSLLYLFQSPWTLSLSLVSDAFCLHASCLEERESHSYLIASSCFFHSFFFSSPASLLLFLLLLLLLFLTEIEFFVPLTSLLIRIRKYSPPHKKTWVTMFLSLKGRERHDSTDYFFVFGGETECIGTNAHREISKRYSYTKDFMI